MKVIKRNIGLYRLMIVSLLAFGVAIQSAFAGLLFYDDIPSTYAEGGNLGAAGDGSGKWVGYSGGSAANITTYNSVIATSNSALTYPSLLAPATGSRGIRVKAPDVGVQYDLAANFTALNNNAAASVYASFLMNIKTLPTANRIVTALQPQPGSLPNTSCKGALILGTNGSLTINTGTSVTPSSSGNGVLTTASLGTNTTHLVVYRYNIVVGSLNDTMDLWLDPSPNSFANPTNIPPPTIQTVTNPGTNADAASIGAFFIHLSSGTTNGEWSFDEVRVGTNWADVTPVESAPDGTLSTVTASPNLLVPADGVTASTITITAKNSAGRGIAGVDPASIVVSNTGTAVVTQPTLATDANGQTTATIRDSVGGNTTITVKINGVAITNYATVQFVATTVQQLVWNGSLGGGIWDIDTTVNWQGGKKFQTNDFVTFDDSASGSTTVNLSTTLTPGSLTISNATKAYTFSGSGKIDGAVGITKNGAATLTIANGTPNTFSNSVIILGGTLKLGGPDILPTTATATFGDVAGAKLDLNNFNQTLSRLSGGGVNGGNVSLGTATLTLNKNSAEYGGVISGSGNVVKTLDGTQTFTGPNTYTGGTLISGGTLVAANPAGSATGTGDVTIQGSSTYLRIGNGGFGGSIAASTVYNEGILRFHATNNLTFTNVIVGSGTVQQRGTNTMVNLTGVNTYSGITVIDYGGLRINNGSALGDSGQFSYTIINNDPSARLELLGNITLAEPLYVNNKSSGLGFMPAILNVSGTNTLTGTMELDSGGTLWSIGVDAGQLTVSSPIVNASGANSTGYRILALGGAANGVWNTDLTDNAGVVNAALQKEGSGTWTMVGPQDYSGNTTINAGTLLVNGTITGGTGTTNVVNVAGGVLGGVGSVGRSVNVGAAGTLAPGTSAVGTLTINGDLNLTGNVLIKVNRSVNPSNDLTVVSGVLTNIGTGTVMLTNVGGLGLVAGNKFKIFNKAVANGGALTIAGTLANGLGWTNNLATDGSISVVNVAPALPPTLEYSSTGNVLTFSWTDPAYRLQSQTNALNVGISTNWFDYPNGGISPVKVTNNSANPTEFFRLKKP